MLYFFALKDAPVFYKHSVGEMRTTKIDLRFAGQKSRKYLCASIWHVKEIDAGHRLEHFAGRVGQTSGPGRRHIDFAGIGLRVGDELRDRLGGN